MRKHRRYISPDPLFKCMCKTFFKCYQILHHQGIWTSCPDKISLKIGNAFGNINLPVTLHHELFIKELELLKADLMDKLSHMCFNHLKKSILFELDQLDVKLDSLANVPSSKILNALIVMKKWIKRSFKSVNHGIISDFCRSLTWVGLEFAYVNNRFKDNMHLITMDDSLDYNTSSEEEKEVCLGVHSPVENIVPSTPFSINMKKSPPKKNTRLVKHNCSVQSNCASANVNSSNEKSDFPIPHDSGFFNESDPFNYSDVYNQWPLLFPPSGD